MKTSEKVISFLILNERKKIWLIMKFCIVFLYLAVIQVSAINVFSQTEKISIEMQNTSVREIVKKIEEQGQVNFFYNENLPELDKRISVSERDKPISEVLASSLSQADMTYEVIKENFYVLIPSRELMQTPRVTGKVTDASTGEALPGVNVYVEGTTHGTITDLDGEYELELSGDSETLIFSYIGYERTRIPVEGRTVINVQLEPDTKEIDEVVVVGYGTMKRADLTGSVSSVSGKQINSIPVSSVSEALTGKMAGVQVKTTDGSPFADVVIRIRGGGSVTQDNSPLFIVDGFPVESIRDISPHNIENIDVLKDASSAAIYGSRGANGVILITTKGAEGGRTKVTYNGYGQIRTLAKKLDVMDPYEFVLMQYEYARVQSGELAYNRFINNFGVYDDLELYKGQRGTDWQEEMLGSPTFSQNHNLDVGGGTEKTRYKISLSDVSDEGILIGNGYDRTNLNFNLKHQASESVELTLAARLINTRIIGAGTSGSANLRMKHILTARPVNGLMDVLDYDFDDPAYYDDYEAFISSFINPRQLVEQDYRKRLSHSYYLNAGLDWDIFKNLMYRSEFGIQYSYGDNYRYYGPLTSRSRNYGSNLPLGDINSYKSDRLRWSNILNYNLNFQDVHRLNMMVGQEIIQSGSSSTFMRAKYFSEDLPPEKMFANMALGEFDQMSSYFNPENKLASFFGRINYFLLDRYIFTATFRADGSSKFAPGNQWGYFPSGAIAWRISNENFMQNQNFISNLKLRASIGAAGNNRIGSDLWKTNYRISTSNPIGFGDRINQYYIPASSLLSNPDLRWETTVTRNVGLDYGLFRNRIGGVVDLYWNTTRDLLVESDIPSYLGYSKQMRNIGQTSNRGIEFTFDARAIQRRDLMLNISFNIGFNQPRIDKLDEVDVKPFYSSWATSDLRESDDYRVIVGETVGLMYGYVFDGIYQPEDFEIVDEETGAYELKEGVSSSEGILGGVIRLRPGVMKLKDLNGDGVITADQDRAVVGNAIPKHTGGLNINTRYKSFDLSMLFNWVYGNDIYNTGLIEFQMLFHTTYGNMLNTMNSERRWMYIDTETGEEITDLNKLAEVNKDKTMWSPFSSGSTKPLFHSGAVEDGSFLRLNTLSLGYTLPDNLTNKLRIERFRIYGTVYNAWIWTNYSGYDPEVSTTQNNSYRQLTPGVDYSAYPKSRSYVLGVNVTF